MNNKWLALIIFLIVGTVFLFIGVKDKNNLSKEPIDLAEADWSELQKGDHVEITVDVVWDCIYTETTTEKTYFITTDEYESARGYAIPNLYVDEDGYYAIDYFIGLRLNNANDYRVIEQIMDETNDWYFDTTGTVDYGMTTFYVDGVLKAMTNEEKDLMKEYLVNYCGYSSSEADSMICPYMIVKANEGSAYASIVAGIFLYIIGIIAFAVNAAQQKKQAAAYARSASYTPMNAVNENAYYTPDNSAPLSGGYQYGGTNAYGNNDIYGGNAYVPQTEKVDENTGLSMDFLKRSEEEKAQREREAQYKAPEPSQNPLYGSQAPSTPVTPSQSFSSYEDTVQSAGNFGGGIYGTRNDQQ